MARHVVILGTAYDPDSDPPLRPLPPAGDGVPGDAGRWQGDPGPAPGPRLVPGRAVPRSGAPRGRPAVGAAIPKLRRRPRRVRWPIPVLAASAMTIVLFVQLTRPVPEPVLSADALASTTVPGVAPALPWPSVGQAAVSVPSTGLLMQSGVEAPVPVASLTKIMTAYQVLRDHPLSASTPGPQVVMTAADESDSAANARANATSVPVVAGQAFSERQLLDGLIVHSANDFADALARWDAGSVAAFVAKMNSQAVALGMRSTHYVDPSGIDDAGTSTAADQLRLAGAAMGIPAFAAVVAQPFITVPGVGLLANYVPAVGTDGVVGVKSGFTQAAMGCVVLAVERNVAGRQLIVLAALTGQQGGVDPIRAADKIGISLIDTVAGGLTPQTLIRPGRQVGSVWVPWSARSAPVVTASGVTTLGWPGDAVRYQVVATRLRHSPRAGEQVGRLVVHSGTQRYVVPLVTSAGLPSPSLRWRFAHH